MPTEEHDYNCARCHRPVSYHPFADCPTPDVLARRPRATPAATFLQIMALTAIAGSRMSGPSRPDFAGEPIVFDSYRGPQPVPKPVVPRSKMRTDEENERRKKRKAQRRSRKGKR